MRIALAQLNYHIGNFEGNLRKILHALEQAEEAGVELLVFAELAITGYPPRDFLEYSDFNRLSLEAIETLAQRTKQVAIIIGAPAQNLHPSGKPLFNAAYFLYQGAIRQIRHKTLLPNYDVFDEYRYFEPNQDFNVLHFKGLKIALTICEDLWVQGIYPLYTRNPMEVLCKQQPDLIINIAASPFHFSQQETRRQVLQANVAHYKLPLIYVNHVGGQTELLFDGGSMALNPDGHDALTMKYFEEDFGLVDWREGSFFHVPHGDISKSDMLPSNVTKQIHDALVMGVRDYFQKLGFQKAVLGLSGGIDSAVVLVLAARALGTENVLGVLMPSAFSSGHSVDDAIVLSRRLGTPYHIISIQENFESITGSLQPLFQGQPFSVAEENIQARLRAVHLMAIANKLGYILLNTSNKSEAAVGYGTLYGDMCGALSVLGDLYKTQVYALAEYINTGEEIIPRGIITKAPSAELRPGQKDSDSLPDYKILDEILFQYIEKRQSPLELLDMGFDEITVKKVLEMVNASEHKRYQAPPILRVSAKAFGSGRRMPIAARYLIPEA